MFQLKSNEDIEIEKVLVTPFEKAIKILKKVINFLGENNPLSEEVNWVLKIIISQKLYSYEVLNKTNFEKESTNDLKLVLGFLNMYSQKDIFNPNINRRSQTVDYHSSDNVRNNISHILSQYKKKVYSISSNSSFSDNKSSEEDSEQIFQFNDDENTENNNNSNSNINNNLNNNNNEENKDFNNINIIQNVNLENKIERRRSYINKIEKNNNLNIKLEIERRKSYINNNNEIHKNKLIRNTDIENKKSFKTAKKKSSKNLSSKSPKKLVSFSSSIPILKNINEYEMEYIENDLFSFEFNVFDFYEKNKNINPFTLASQILLQKYDIIYYSDPMTLFNFLKALQEHYTKVAIYHTEKHAIDMLQTLFIYISKSNAIDYLFLNKLDIISLLVAGVCHDVGHKGYNNEYQMKMYTDLAITYNDKSILENYHITLTFKLLKNDKLNIFRNISKNDFSYIRKRIIDLIFSTDMFYHSRIIALMKSRIENKNIKNGINSDKIISDAGNNLFNEQQEVLNYLIHIGDISHSTKLFKITYKWSYLLTQEFWRQGDEEKEKGFSVNFLYDRNNIDIGRNQVGFIKGIIIPSFDILVNFLPEMSYYTDNMKINLRKWEELSEELNKKKELEKNKKK